MKAIVYNQTNGIMAIVYPAPDCPLTLEQIAEKDVPSGVDYWIVDQADIPTDRSQRNAWTANFTRQPDGQGGDYGNT